MISLCIAFLFVSCHFDVPGFGFLELSYLIVNYLIVNAADIPGS